ncbi:Spy/CpxP family protein refolding chaperone [Roseicella aerolata]|uniref:Spy/CpxP family protein refolding chaperone n=1 Tax=Roseicella aerolata TaxID=2883479 RepID=A0A9X1IDR7_9PROT|nr:Spy/CpxP family protein refolding chaperone [Roseicella aerolata]MCB4821428.1 Spy/CpxP family protein refolding chaperone [Roseicella aerolata]
MTGVSVMGIRGAFALALALGFAGPAAAQQAQDADHAAHHPEGQQVAQQPAPPAPPPAAPAPARPGTPGMGMPGMGMPAPGGMPGMGMPGMGMQGEMGQMMQMMQRMMAMRGGMQPFRRIEGQIAYLRTELRITDAQAPQWNAFADAVRTAAGQLRQAHAQPGQAGQTPTAPEQLERRAAMLATELEATRAVAAAAGSLYAVLSEEQRRTADELMAEHLRGMRMRGL